MTEKHDSKTVGFAPDQVIVAIPTLNEERHIAACLRSLVDNCAFTAETKIVVADGGSTDRTRQVVEDLQKTLPHLHLIDNPAKFQSAAINAVAEQEAGPKHLLLVRCDAHAVYPPGYVRDVVASFGANSEAASIATVMDAQGSSCFQRASAWVVDTPFGSGGSAHRGGSRSGWVDHAHHAGFRLSWFRKIGGYDPTFTHNEDAEYDHRLGLAGGKIWLDAGIRMDYQMRPTLGGLAKQYWRYGRGRARTVLKHQMRPRLRQLIPAINVLLLAITTLLGFVWTPALIFPALYLGALVAISAFAVAKMKSLCGLYAGVSLAIMHNFWGAGFVAQCLASIGKSSAKGDPAT